MLQHDMPVMSENAKVLASTMPKVPTDTRHNGGSGKQYPKKAKATAMIDRQSVTFTELELAALVVGKYIQFELEKNGNLRQVIGKVAYQEAKKTTSGHTIPASWRFTVDRNIDVDGMNAYNAAIDAKQDQPHPTDEQVASVIEEQTRTQPISTVQTTNGELYTRDEVPVTSEPEPTQIVLSALSLGQSMLDIIDAQVMDANASHAESENKSDTANIETNFSDSEKIVEPNHVAKPIVQPEPTAESDIVSPTKRLGAQPDNNEKKTFSSDNKSATLDPTLSENTDMTSDNQTVAATESINDQLRQAHNVSAFETYALIDQQMYSLDESDWQLTKDDLIKLAEDMPVLRGGRQAVNLMVKRFTLSIM